MAHPLDQTNTEGRLAQLETLIREDRRFNEAHFRSLENAVHVSIAAAKEATGKAERATELRFDSVNEFRKTLTDQTSTFVTRSTFEEFQKALHSIDRESHGDRFSTWALLIAAAAVVIAVLGFFRHSV